MHSIENTTISDFKDNYFEKYKQLFIIEFGFYIVDSRMKEFKDILTKHIKKTSYLTFDTFYTYLTNTIPGKILLKQIIEDITIGETYFFRNQPQLDVFVEHILPEFIKQKRIYNDHTINIWSAGCSTGEEPYSLAILLLENLPAPSTWKIKITATDINRNSLQIAQNGIYSGYRPKQHIPRNILEKYFKIDDYDKFMINESVKQYIQFKHHNLVKDLPPVDNPDIIFCRNVTIYFNVETTKKIINNFYKILHDKGYLFLGHSETIWQICDKFVTRDFPKGFVYQKDLLHPEKQNKPINSAVIPEFNLESLSSKSKDKSVLSLLSNSFEIKDDISEYKNMDLEKVMMIDVKYHQGVVAFEGKDYITALNIFNEIIAKHNSYMMAHFAKATLLSNQGEYQEAIKSLNFLIEKDNLFLEAYFLKAILQLKINESDNAIKTFQQVIYINPDHALAYFHLINLYKQSNKMYQAVLACKNIIRICTDKKDDEIVPFSDSLTYGTLNIISNKILEEIK